MVSFPWDKNKKQMHRHNNWCCTFYSYLLRQDENMNVVVSSDPQSLSGWWRVENTLFQDGRPCTGLNTWPKAGKPLSELQGAADHRSMSRSLTLCDCVWDFRTVRCAQICAHVDIFFMFGKYFLTPFGYKSTESLYGERNVSRLKALCENQHGSETRRTWRSGSSS